jgi:hypothetical protein
LGWDGRRSTDTFLSFTEQSVADFHSNLSYSTTVSDRNPIAVSTTTIYDENPDAPERWMTEIIAEAVHGCAL